jgi:hypothetical protein
MIAVTAIDALPEAILAQVHRDRMAWHVARRSARIDPARRIRRIITVTAVNALAEAVAAQLNGLLGVPVVTDAVGRIEATVQIVAVAAVDALPEATATLLRAARAVGQRRAILEFARIVDPVAVSVTETDRHLETIELLTGLLWDDHASPVRQTA